MVWLVAAPKILVVDDEPTVREVVAQYLVRDGYEVRELDRGDLVEAAVAQFQDLRSWLSAAPPADSDRVLLRLAMLAAPDGGGDRVAGEKGRCRICLPVVAQGARRGWGHPDRRGDLLFDFVSS